MNENERKVVVRRMLLLIAVACIIMGLYTFRLIFLQLVNGDSFKAKATNTTDYKFTVTAARGNIVDSTGKRIATTSTGYNVVLNKLQMGDQDLDTMLQQIVELLRKNDEKWLDTLLISEPDAAGNYTFTDSADSTSDQKTLADMKETLGLQQYATANDVMEMLVEKNHLESFSLPWQRVLAGIHYEMDRQAFSNVNNFVMAENVSQVTVATIKEHSLTLPGVEIVETSTRSYEQGDILPAVLGRVGKITAEKWKVTDENGQVTYPLKEKGYNMNDVVGISGLESVYEDELRGKDGVETITRNSDGVIVDTKITTVPEPGHTVQLTINSDFQRAVDKALANNIDMINRVYNTGDMKAAACAAVVLDVKDGSVEFDHVSFRYSGKNKKFALTDIDLKIPSGSTIGIIGGTGSAKTTLIQLIPRLYDVTVGAVKVGGRDVREYDLQALRDAVAVVLQKNVLFSGTIKENLRWGNKNATDEELIHACRLAQADEFVTQFPDGYDTYIEQGGTNVSGGQKQRICIARAILKKPKILILDDSTSAVDTKTDALIRQAFKNELPDTTKIIIAQRISSVQEADQILVLEDGKIIGHGTHEELLKTCETYSEIYTTQIGNQSIGTGEEAAV